MLAIAYYRGWIDSYANREIISALLREVESCDVVIAPIADNRMFDLINEFAEGYLTDEQCQHALAASNLGMQYVLKSDKALEQLKPLQSFFVCQGEIDHYKNRRVALRSQSIDKVKAARIEYKGKGKYIEEIFL